MRSASPDSEVAGLLSRRGFQAVMVAVLLMLAVPFGVWGLAHVEDEREAARHEAFDKAIELARDQAQRHDAVIGEATSVATLLAALPEVQAGGEPCAVRLAAMLDEMPRYNNLFATNGEGRTTCTARGEPGISIADRPYFWQALETQAPAVGNYTVSRATGVPIVAVAVPFDAPLLGVAGASVRLDTLHQGMQHAAESGAMVVILDQDGTILARSEDQRFIGESAAVWPDVEGRHAGTFVAEGNDGVRRLWASQAVTDEAGVPVAYVVAGHAASDVYGPITDRFRREVILFLAVSVAAVAATWAVSDRTLGRHERLLTRSEARFRTYFELSPDPMCITDARGVLLEVNPALERVLGLRHQELVGRPFLDFVHPEDRERTAAAYREPSGGGAERPFENRYLRPDGQVVWFDWHWRPGPEGLIYAIARDITHRKEAEAALRREHDRLEEAQSIAHIGSWEWEAATDRTTMSKEGCRIWHVREGTVLSSGGLLALVQEEDRARFEAESAAAAQDGTDFDVTVRVRTPLGSRWIRHRGRVAAKFPDGKPARFLGTVEDITDKRRAEEERAQLELARAEADRLAQLNEFKTRFIGMVSHDLNNVLSPMLIHLKMVETASQPVPSLREPVDGLRRNVRRLSRFLADLLDATRLQSGELRLAVQPVDVAAVVRSALADAEREAADRGVLVRSEVPPSVTLPADPHRLDQVVTNLLSNALKFTPRGGTVTVTVAEEPEQVRIEVADSGPGISVQDLPKLFRPFSRVGDGAQQRHTGTGLGLFICKGIAEAHGGSIHAASAGLGHGARFTVVLPRDGPPAPPIASP